MRRIPAFALATAIGVVLGAPSASAWLAGGDGAEKPAAAEAGAASDDDAASAGMEAPRRDEAAEAPRASARRPDAAPAGRIAPAAGADEPESWAGWVQSLEKSVADIRELQAKVDEMEGTLALSHHRRWPRGEAKAKLIADLAAAREELADAREKHPEILEQARQAGVPAGVLDQYEIPGS
jgi:hypothetical protein